ncbi:MAG: hypothetical protein E7675_08520, partial [Ruminococcaceae bacterium]|nr:hypothetical protein [Oscillospiraceae bacterium]
MNRSKAAVKRGISLLLLMTMCVCGFSSCKEGEPPATTQFGTATPIPSLTNENTNPDTEGDTSMYTSSNYVKKYSDNSAMENWLKENITNSEKPP